MWRQMVQSRKDMYKCGFYFSGEQRIVSNTQHLKIIPDGSSFSLWKLQVNWKPSSKKSMSLQATSNTKNPKYNPLKTGPTIFYDALIAFILNLHLQSLLSPVSLHFIPSPCIFHNALSFITKLSGNRQKFSIPFYPFQALLFKWQVRIQQSS